MNLTKIAEIMESFSIGNFYEIHSELHRKYTAFRSEYNDYIKMIQCHSTISEEDIRALCDKGFALISEICFMVSTLGMDPSTEFNRYMMEVKNDKARHAVRKLH